MNDLDSPESESPKGSTERAILAVVLSLAVYWAWTTWFAPPPPPPPAETTATQAGPAQAGITETTATQAGAEAAPPTGDVPPEGAGLPGAVVPTPEAPPQVFPAQSTEWAGEWTTRGGTLSHLKLQGYLEPTVVTPIYTWLWGRITGSRSDSWQPYVESEEPVHLLGPEGLLGVAGGMDQGFLDGHYEVLSQDSSQARFQRVTPAGLRITKEFRAGTGPYQGELTLRFENVSPNPLQGRLWVGVADTMAGEAGRYSNALRPVALVDGSLELQDDVKSLASSPKSHDGLVSWLGIHNRYFLAALVPEGSDWGLLTFAGAGTDQAGAYLVAPTVTLASGESREVRFLVYAGPKESTRLGQVGHDLQKSVQYGWFGFFARILLWLLQFIHDGVQNWGLAIIGLTFLVKAVFYPLTQKSFKSSKEMQKLQPVLAEMREKYKDNKDMQTQETMRLFKEHNVNPMGGCLPTLVQLPVWIALYNVLLFSVDLYHTEFLVFRDLSGPDPYAVLPLIVGVLMFVQQRMTPMTGLDPAQARMMQAMPFIFVFFIFSFPSGLAIYICVNSILSILQQWLINRAYRT